MLNVNLLKGRMAEKGFSQKSLATKIGMSDNTLSSRMQLHSPFNTDEIDKICDILEIVEPMDKINIFLHKTSQNMDNIRGG